MFKKLTGGLLVLSFLVLFLGMGAVEVLALTGEEILGNLDETMTADNKIMEQEMILYTGSGSERNREVRVWNKTGEDGSKKMLLKFTAPASIAGTSFLIVDDDMWLYMPALGKVRRIAGSAKQGNFMGSDLSYEDMEALGSTGFKNDYIAKVTAEEEGNNGRVYQLELIPREGAGVAYSMLELIVDGSKWLPLEIKYYNQSGEVEKVLTTSGHEKIEGRWTATRMEMENVMEGSRTVLKVKEVSFNEEINDNIFTTRYLERGL